MVFTTIPARTQHLIIEMLHCPHPLWLDPICFEGRIRYVEMRRMIRCCYNSNKLLVISEWRCMGDWVIMLPSSIAN